MKLSPAQQSMFQQLTAEYQDVDKLRFRGSAFRTAVSLEKKGLLVLKNVSAQASRGGPYWGVRLSDDWQRMEHLEKTMHNVEGTPAEHTKAHKAREAELDNLYAKLG